MRRMARVLLILAILLYKGLDISLNYLFYAQGIIAIMFNYKA